MIGAEGDQLGIMTSAAALALAEEKNLDLVKIAPNAVPPVCKIMDYGKFRFEQLKKEKEARKNQKVVEVKEIRMSPSIDTNDFNTKVKNAQKFLKDGNRVESHRSFPRPRNGAHLARRRAAASSSALTALKLPPWPRAQSSRDATCPCSSAPRIPNNLRKSNNTEGEPLCLS